ncbi:replicative DNA helicase [Raineyella sp. LH-20]|uniref:replicative DNA helicase n=1 Tax=Raineyella sp. LH-20 TaxID=3081204 RepID=UPI0029544706|nr:replicative DNA helicase [Raineyella sp. LH-20]WOP19736.1 replicative DNA helicase [Raineyella sp. LH-20]
MRRHPAVNVRRTAVVRAVSEPAPRVGPSNGRSVGKGGVMGVVGLEQAWNADHREPDRPGPGPDRQPPQDLVAEQSVLGAMMISKDAIAEVIELVRSDDFYKPAHELIFDAIIHLYSLGEPADAITVAEQLTKRGDIARVGGHTYLYDLVASVSVAANAGYYAQIVRDKAVLRRLVQASIKIAQLGYNAEGDVDDIVDEAQATMFAVADRRTTEDYKPLEQLIEPTMDQMELIEAQGGVMSGVPTGFAELDELTAGLHAGQMIIIAARPGMGKALALDTPLPTPTGWTTMGDVRVGDRLLDANGLPTTVVAATEVMTERPCYRITFSDGTTVVADAEHEWNATNRTIRRWGPASDRRAEDPRVASLAALVSAGTGEPDRQVTMADLLNEVGDEYRNTLHAVGRGRVQGRLPVQVQGPSRSYTWGAPAYSRREMLTRLHARTAPVPAHTTDPITVTTEVMAASVRCADGRANWAVRTCAPLDLPEAQLPVPPYALGVWLGDGHTDGARFVTADQEIVDALRATGLVIERRTGLNHSLRRESRTESVQADLRTLGVLGNKHIPDAYQRASAAQRLELLRGLMDTDGTVTNAGACQFVVTDEQLADDVRELVVSLGWRCTARTKAVRGRDAARSTAYLLNFTPDARVFHLSRKAALQAPVSRRTSRTDTRYVTAVERIDSVPVRCVQVDNAEHLYLATESMIPTHNSTLGLDICRSASIKHGLTSCIFSLEMNQTEITMRMLSAEASVPLSHMRQGTMSSDEWDRVSGKASLIGSAPLFVDDSPNLTMMEIRAKARRLKQQHDLKLIVLDYLQLMSSGKKVESRQLEVSEFSRQMKLLAKELELPVIAISQLNRNPEKRDDKRPSVSDLRESGSLEQDADVIILVHRDDYYNKDDSSRVGEADIIVAKHRNGPTKTVTVAFQGHYSRFTDMAH